VLLVRPSSLRQIRAFVVASLMLAAVPTASRADVRLLDAYAGPVTADSACTAEPPEPYFGTGAPLAWTPGRLTVPYADWDGWELPYPDILDGQQARLQAGASTDYCLAFRTTPQSSGEQASMISARDTPYPPADTRTGPRNGDDLSRLTVDLPAGYLASLAGRPTCSEAQFGEGANTPGAADDPAACPADSRVGTVSARATTFGSPASNGTGLMLLIPGYGRSQSVFEGTTFGGDPTPTGNSVYLLDRRPGDLATLGLDINSYNPSVMMTRARVSIRLAPDGSGRLQAISDPMPRYVYKKGNITGNTALGARFPIYLESVGITTWGAASDHTAIDDPTWGRLVEPLATDFSESGTDCSAPATTRFSATTYGAPVVAPAEGPVTSSLERSFQLTGCEQLEFHPSVQVTTTARTPNTPTGATVRVRLGQQTSNGLRTALLRDAAVTLPAGLELGAQVGSDEDGLTFCSPQAFNAADATVASACPAATQAATVRIVTPLLDQGFTGRAWLGQPVAGNDLPQLYLEAALAGATEPDAPRIKLVGTVQASDDGTLTTTFTNAPQLRFSELELTFPGGDHALFVTPQRCGTTTGRSALTPWSGRPAATVDATLTIDQDCDAPAAPTVTVTPLDPQAGKKAATRIDIARPAGAPWFKRIDVHLPSGMLADLNAASECAAAPARTGDCPESSRIGTVRVLAGAGAKPLPLDGALYLAERESGAVAGAVIVTRAKVGDLDLGTVVVPGRIELRPEDAGLDFRTDVPLRFKGVALGLQRVTVDLDRDGFGLNPTACGPLAYSADITDDAGTTRTASGAATYTGCAALPFRPELRAKLTGQNTPGGFPGMYVELNAPAGDSAMRSAIVTLPAGVAAALPNVQNPCPRADFDALRCPARTRVGSATARVSITPEPITGDIYLVKVPGKTLPGLGLSFTGRYAQRVLSSVEVNKDGRLVTNFAAIPDLPLRQLVVQVDAGPRSPLQIPPDGACARSSGWDARFVAQGGQTATARTGLQCAAPAAARLTDRRGLSVRLFDFGGRKLSYVKATLPAGWRFDRAAARRKNALWVRMTGATPAIQLTSRSLVARTRNGEATDVRIKIGGGVVRPTSRRAAKAKTLTIPLRLAFTDGTIEIQRITAATR
jgi:hypothetical protein